MHQLLDEKCRCSNSFNKVSGSIVVLSEISFHYCARGEPWMTIEQRRVHDYLGFEEKSFKNKAGFFYPVRFSFAQLSRKMTNEARFLIWMDLRTWTSVMFWNKLIFPHWLVYNYCYFTPVQKLKSLVNEDTLLRTHCFPWCFLGCANWETFVGDTNCFWTKSETFLCPGHKICVRNKCCALGQTGKHLCRQQCVRNNVSSFARALKGEVIKPGSPNSADTEAAWVLVGGVLTLLTCACRPSRSSENNLLEWTSCMGRK